VKAKSVRGVSFALLMIGLLACSSDDGRTTQRVGGQVPEQVPCAESLTTICEAVDRYAQQLMAESATPGMAVALLLPDGRLDVRTYGVADVHTGAPIEAETLFQIGSISKTFTGIALSQLIDEGRFDPAAPITAALPWFRLKNEFAPITGHHLLTHTAGLPVNRDDVVGSHYMVWALRDRQPGFPPGERFSYSNMGYQVLHVTLETLEGQPIRDIIRRRIFEPLGMNASRAGFTHAQRHTIATGYQPTYDDRPWHPSHGLVEAPWHEYDIGDGNVVSNG